MFTITTFLGVLLSFFISWWFLKRRVKNYPPGPYSYPIIGNLLQLGTRPETTFIEWTKIYGKVFSLKMGMENVVVINDYKMIKEAFSDINFTGKPKNEIMTFHSKGSYGIVSAEGAVWESQRRFLLRSLRDFGFGKSSMEGLIEEEVKEVLEHFQENEGKGISVEHTFGLAVLNSLWTIACGQRFSQKDPKLNDILAKMKDAFKQVGESGLAFAPWLRYIAPNLSGYTKLMTAADDWHSLFRETIAEHMDNFSENTSRDFIDLYITEMNKTKDPTSSFYKKSGAGEKNLLAVVADIFLAGAETSSAVLNWSTLYLSSFPEVQKKLQEEIDRVVGNSRAPRLSDRLDMPFVEATILEILRHTSLVPLGAAHTTLTDVEFQGFKIPKGTFIMANLYAVHHHPDIWGDPENFRPERFLSKDGQTVQKHEALIPFHIGKRNCLGESLARDTLFLFIVNIFHRFTVIPDPIHFNAKFDLEATFFRQPKPFKVIFKDRQK